MHKKLVIAINGICHSRCHFCQYKRFTGENSISFDDLKQYRDTYIAGRFTQVLLTDGEPINHPDFIAILKYVLEFTSDCIIESNSERFSNKDFIQEISQLPGYQNLHIKIPIYGANEKIHNTITSGNLRKMLLGVKNLETIGITKISFHCLVLKQNYKYLSQLQMLVSKLGYTISFIYTIPDGYIESQKLLVSFSEVYTENKDTIDIENIPKCIANTYSNNQNINYSKTTIIEGKSIEFTNDFASNRLQKIYIDTCNSCSRKDECSGIYRSYISLFGAGEFKAII